MTFSDTSLQNINPDIILVAGDMVNGHPKEKTDPAMNFMKAIAGKYPVYYENGNLHQTEFLIWGKLIRREVFNEVIDGIGEYYYNQHMSLHEDGLILFILFRKAKSYIFINSTYHINRFINYLWVYYS